MTLRLADHIAAEIRAEMARKQPRLSQRWLAGVLGLSQAQVSERMRGEVEFRVSELEQIATALDVPVTKFLPAEVA